MSVSHKQIYIISPNQFYVVSKCFMQVFYIDKFEVDICDISVFSKKHSTACKNTNIYSGGIVLWQVLKG